MMNSQKGIGMMGMAVVLLFGVIALLGLLYKYNATLFSMGGSAERAKSLEAENKVKQERQASANKVAAKRVEKDKKVKANCGKGNTSKQCAEAVFDKFRLGK